MGFPYFWKLPNALVFSMGSKPLGGHFVGVPKTEIRVHWDLNLCPPIYRNPRMAAHIAPYETL